MGMIDINRLALVLGLVLMVFIAAANDYRLEIGKWFFKFEKNMERTDTRLVPPRDAGEKRTP